MKTKEVKVTKHFDGERYTYCINGKLHRRDKREYKYACVALLRNDEQIITALGNNEDTTFRSNLSKYDKWGCAMEVVEIETI